MGAARAQTKNERGNLPIHFAAAKQASEKIVRCLLEAYPEGAQQKDEAGKLPLQIAAEKQASEVSRSSAALAATAPLPQPAHRCRRPCHRRRCPCRRRCRRGDLRTRPRCTAFEAEG